MPSRGKSPGPSPRSFETLPLSNSLGSTNRCVTTRTATTGPTRGTSLRPVPFRVWRKGPNSMAQIPFLALRANDWVDAVAARGTELLISRLRSDNRHAVVNALPFIVRVLRQHRRDHDGIERALKLVLLSDGGDDALARSSQFDTSVQRKMYELLIPGTTTSNRRLFDAALKDPDPVSEPERSYRWPKTQSSGIAPTFSNGSCVRIAFRALEGWHSASSPSTRQSVSPRCSQKYCWTGRRAFAAVPGSSPARINPLLSRGRSTPCPWLRASRDNSPQPSTVLAKPALVSMRI